MVFIENGWRIKSGGMRARGLLDKFDIWRDKERVEGRERERESRMGFWDWSVVVEEWGGNDEELL